MKFQAFVMASLLSAGAGIFALPAHAQSKGSEIANPASEYCVSIGGTSFSRRTPSGDVGYCRLPNGKVVEEWKLFRESQKRPPVPKRRDDMSMANPAAVHCSKVGGTNLNRRTPQGDVALCRLRNGKTVDAWALYRRDDGKRPGPAKPGMIGLANPASGYCLKQKGRLEMREGPGGTTGFCHLPGGRVVEEWRLYREHSTGRPR